MLRARLPSAPCSISSSGRQDVRAEGGQVTAEPHQRAGGRVDGAGEPGPRGRRGDAEPPAAGEGRPAPGPGAHRLGGKEETDRRG